MYLIGHLRAIGQSARIHAAIVLVLALGGMSYPALAHHPMGGATPSNWLEGLLSGIGHPVIGLDHLVFLIGLAALSAARPRPLVVGGAFIALSLLGVMVHDKVPFAVPVESLIALSVVLLGAVLARQWCGRRIAAGIAGAGFLHGLAFGEAIAGAEVAPMVSYLSGLGVSQMLLYGASVFAVQQLTAVRGGSMDIVYRVAGCLILAIGLAMAGLTA